MVCYGIKKTQKGEYKIKISDPARDKIVISEDDFLKHWLSTKVDGKNIGTALLLTPSPEFYQYTL